MGPMGGPRIVWTQFQNIKGNDLGQFKDPATEVVVLPAEFKSGTLIYPYSAAKQ
jgi:branched-chain amino acid transport system substrate-binding protein